MARARSATRTVRRWSSGSSRSSWCSGCERSPRVFPARSSSSSAGCWRLGCSTSAPMASPSSATSRAGCLASTSRTAGLLWDHAGTVALAAVALMLIGFSQTAGDARAFAAKHRYQIDVNQESVAQALANIGAGAPPGHARLDQPVGQLAQRPLRREDRPGVAHLRGHRPADAARPGAAVLRAAASRFSAR